MGSTAGQRIAVDIGTQERKEIGVEASSSSECRHHQRHATCIGRLAEMYGGSRDYRMYAPNSMASNVMLLICSLLGFLPVVGHLTTGDPLLDDNRSRPKGIQKPLKMGPHASLDVAFTRLVKWTFERLNVYGGELCGYVSHTVH